MARIFVFPGQGAQSVGMGYDLYNSNASVREVFDAVDSALGEKLSDIIFNGPIETLTLTANVQPAILATSIAMFRAANLPMPDYVAGHSLGEYTALCAAGAISLADTAKILRIRGNAMQAAVPVGAGITAVQESRLQLGMVRKIALDPRRINPASGLPLQIFVAADVVGIGVRVVDGSELPAVRVKNLADLAAGVLVVPTVDEADVLPVQADEADLRGALDVIAAVCDLY